MAFDQRAAAQQQQQQHQQMQQPVVQTIVVDNGGFNNADSLQLNKLHECYDVTYAKHLTREHLVETTTGGKALRLGFMTDDRRSKIVTRMHVAADVYLDGKTYCRELLQAIKHEFDSNDGIPEAELEEVIEAYDGFVNARRKAFEPKPDGDQIVCLTQSTAKFPAHYPRHAEARKAFDALKKLRRRIAVVICFATQNVASVRVALEEANEDDVVCKRVLDSKLGYDFLTLAKAKRGRGRAPAAAGTGAEPANPAESKSAQRRRRREERAAQAKQPQATAAPPTNAPAEARATAAPTGAASNRKPGHSGAPAGAAANGRTHS